MHDLITTDVIKRRWLCHVYFFVLQVVNHVGRMSRSRRKLLVYGLIVGTVLLFVYNLRSCPQPEAQNVFMVPKEVSYQIQLAAHYASNLLTYVFSILI